MKAKTPRGIWALRAVTVTITLIALLVVGAVAYSAYEDYSAVKAKLSPGSGGSSAQAVMQGTSEIISINVTIPNRGLFPLNVTVSCDRGDQNVVCQTGTVRVLPGQDGLLSFKMTVVDLARYSSSSDKRINGTVAMSLDPFASLKVGVDLGGFAAVGVG